MEKAKLVVVFPVYNGAQTLLDSLDNIAKQDFQDFKAIILENCSTDDSLDIACYFCERDSRFEIFHNEEHLSAMQNFIHAVDLAKERGEYFCLRACDDDSTLDYLSKLVAALEADPTKLLATSDTKRFEGDTVKFIAPNADIFNFVENAKAGKPPKTLGFPSDWLYGVFRSDGGAAIFQERLPELGRPWCAASYTVAEFVMRNLVVYVEGPCFHFYRGSDSQALYAAKSFTEQVVQRWRYTTGCYRVLDKLPPLSPLTKARILRMCWRDSRRKTGYRLLKTLWRTMSGKN